MAFQPPNIGQEKKNLKIIEQLEEQKKRLRGQIPDGGPIGQPMIAADNFGAAAFSQPGNVIANPQSRLAKPQHMSKAQSAALQHAHGNSVGYFITQDSSFGNLILPVLPRFNGK